MITTRGGMTVADTTGGMTVADTTGGMTGATSGNGRLGGMTGRRGTRRKKRRRHPLMEVSYIFCSVGSCNAPRKRKSRWGAETAKVEMPGLPSQITGNVSQLELDNYAIHVRLEEIGRKLRSNDVVPPPGQRSPSPPPEYDAYGRRTNTLELRYKKRLEDERIQLIDRAMKADPTFKPPSDAMGARGGRFGRPQDKVYIPVKEFPEINFFGLLVGPRGNSLKNMERQSGAKISIRGKGSVKEGKGRQEQFPHDEDDELHCLVTADDEYKVKKCVALINKVIETVSH